METEPAGREYIEKNHYHILTRREILIYFDRSHDLIEKILIWKSAEPTEGGERQYENIIFEFSAKFQYSLIGHTTYLEIMSI